MHKKEIQNDWILATKAIFQYACAYISEFLVYRCAILRMFRKIEKTRLLYDMIVNIIILIIKNCA